MNVNAPRDYRRRLVLLAETCRQGWRRGVFVALLSMAVSVHAWGQENVPTGHFTVPDPAALTDTDAEAIYQRLLDDMVRGYQLSNQPVARSYLHWRRFNRTPYRSDPHGERFVNHYANRIGQDVYGTLKEGKTMPVGTVIAKDSFSVTKAGEIYPGPLFLMEKMPEGFNAAGQDWRFTMIMPDGSLLGVTNGPDSRKVEFCQNCHRTAGKGKDSLFFVPERYRIPSPAE